jgi:hypothetical protein
VVRWKGKKWLGGVWSWVGIIAAGYLRGVFDLVFESALGRLDNYRGGTKRPPYSLN